MSYLGTRGFEAQVESGEARKSAGRLVIASACAFAGGVAIVAGGLAIGIVSDPATARQAVGGLVLTGGLAELVVARFRERREGAFVHYLIGAIALSLVAGLALAPTISASGLCATVAIWLAAQGALSLLASLTLAPASRVVELGWLFRAMIDLILGLLALVVYDTSLFWQAVIGWPPTMVSSAILFVSLSLVASALFYLSVLQRPVRDDGAG